MSDAVATAQAAVAADLGDQRWQPALDAAAEHRRWWLSQWPEGAEHVLGLLAQDAQEAVHAVDPGWPPCTEPSCPEAGRHALFVEPDLGPDPFWVCHTTGLPVAAVGSLHR
ncbi:MAG: hypothetical protein WD794_05740 [Mycobacteriales bacterium]